jgi:hypothetical protein
MKESAQSQRRRTKQSSGAPEGDEGRARKAVADRSEAVRRWIDDEDEPAVRGID